MSWDVIGRPCLKVIQNLAGDGETPVCHDGCPSLKATREGRIPLVYDVWMLCASGQRKQVVLTPLVIGATEASGTVLVHLFHERDDRAKAERAAGAVESLLATGSARETPELSEENSQVTPRELRCSG